MAPRVVFASLVILQCVQSVLWYAYSANKHFDADCNTNVSAVQATLPSNKLTTEESKRFHLWSDVMSSDDLEKGETLVEFHTCQF